MARNKKSLENSILVVLFIFGSIGAYMVFANSSTKKDQAIIQQPTLQMDKQDFTNYTTAKPSLD